MKTSSYEFTDEDRKYFVKTRGKLSLHKITIFSTFILYDKMLIYLLLKLFSIVASRLKKFVPNPDKLTTLDFYFVKLVDSFTTIIILSGIYDFTLYCAHQLLHHDTNLIQTSETNVSYYQACLCFILVFVEIVFMFEGLVNLDTSLYEKYEAKIDELKKFIIDQQNNTIEDRTKAKERLMYYRRRFEYDQGSMRIFFTKGLKA